MQFSILGPLEVRRDGRVVALGGSKPRAVLACLLLHANEPVSAERLVAALWGDDASPASVRTVQVHVSRLRKALGDHSVVVSSPAGYRLRVPPGELDADRFERLLERGQRSLAKAEAEDSAAVFREALGLWRGPALADLAFEPFAQTEIARLEEQRLTALQGRIEADLALGRHGELIAELEQLVGEHPLRERLHCQLMLALYRSGRQADALASYRYARRLLVEQLGLEPATEMRQLQEAILAHDPAIAAPQRSLEARASDVSAASTSGRRSGGRRLPVPPNRTIGRGHEVRAVRERLQTPSRLVTLTGPGGVGKTRLALEVGRAVETDFSDGAQFVSLAALQRPEDVAPAMVSALEIVALAGEPADQAVARFLSRKHQLLVLDNFEHVLGAAPFVAWLLAACPAISVLATSREPLSLHAEECYPVSPLSLPAPEIGADLAVVASVDAVALFAERARAHNPRFALESHNAAAVAEICRRLDGLPLAIELAAARCRLLAPAELAERLNTALADLGPGARDAPARQRTLRATIEWSHGLLADREKTYFARFGVFAGSATVDAAETVTGAAIETLDQLVAKSLLVARERYASTRLEMLGSVREYATERLAAVADRDAVHERHYGYFLGLAERHGSDRALWGTDRNAHLARLDADVDNLHAALGWAVRDAGVEKALKLCRALGPYWLTRARYADAVAWTERVLALPGAAAHPELRIRAHTINSWGHWPLGHEADQVAALAEAEAEARSLDDPLVLSDVLQMRATQEAIARRQDNARALAEEAFQCAIRARDDWSIASAAYRRALAAETADFRERVDQAATLLDASGNTYQLAELLALAAYTVLRRNGERDMRDVVDRARDARDFVERARPIARRLDSPFLWMLLHSSEGFAALLTDQIKSARRAFRDQLKLCRAFVMVPLASDGLAGLAAVASVRGDLERAARLAASAGALRSQRISDRLDETLDKNFFEPARARHTPAAWDAAAAEGSALEIDAAIAYALDDARGQAQSTLPRP